MKVKIHKFFKILAVFAFVLFMVFSSFIQAFFFAYAENSVETKRIINFDETAIEDDLKDLDLDSKLYPKNENGTAKVVSFIEYCYGLEDYYGLYFYVYNPSATALQATYVSIATAFDENGNGYSFKSCKISQVSCSSDMLFLKYKLNSTDLYNRIMPVIKAYATSHNGVRRYEIKDISLIKSNNISVNMIYEFSGQANGTGNVEKQLTCYSSERLHLQTNFANYRTGDYSSRTCDEVQTVYFSIPNKYLDTYGKLQQITAEWDEYKTTPIFVTTDLNVCNGLKPHLGEEIYIKDSNGNLKQKYTKAEMPWNVLWEEYNPPHDISRFYSYYNAFDGLDFILEDGGEQSRMDWLFYIDPAEIETLDDYRISREDIIDWAKKYETYQSGLDNIKFQSSSGAWYHEYLFEDSIDEDRQRLLTNYENGATRGHIKQTIDAGDKISLTVASDKSWWDKMWSGGWYEEKDYSPIVLFNENTLLGTEDSFSETYLISKQDSKNVRDFCEQALQNDETPVLFRFAKTDYYSSQARFDKAGNNSLSPVDGYVAQETVFLGFDIISLLFRNENKDTLVSVAMDPVDVFNGVEGPSGMPLPNDWDWLIDSLKQIVTVGIIALAVVLFVALLGPIVFPALGWLLKMIFKGIVFIISLPFKLIGKLFKRKRK